MPVLNPYPPIVRAEGAQSRHRRSRYCTLAVLALLMTLSCGGELGVSPGPGPIVQTTVLIAAGDIGLCGSLGAAQTGAMLDNLQGTILAVGDLAYPHGTMDDFIACYDPVWGRHKSRTKPAPGNHEYETAAAQPYFDYFGAA